MAKSKLTPEQHKALIEAINNLRKEAPQLSQKEIVATCITAHNLPIKVYGGTVVRYWKLATGEEPTKRKIKSTEDSLPPEQRIAFYEKKIEEAVRELDSRRTELMEKVRHLDDVIAARKYANNKH